MFVAVSGALADELAYYAVELGGGLEVGRVAGGFYNVQLRAGDDLRFFFQHGKREYAVLRAGDHQRRDGIIT